MDKLFAGGFADRLAIWRAAWWMFLQAPVMGVGWGQFAWHDFEFRALFGTQFLLPAQNAHNLPLHFLAETGLLGASIVTGGAVLWLRGLRKDVFSVELWWLLALFVTIGTHSMLEFPLWCAFFLGVAAIGLGLGETRGYALGSPRIVPSAMAVLLVLGFVNAALLWHNYGDFQRTFVQGGAPFA